MPQITGPGRSPDERQGEMRKELRRLQTPAPNPLPYSPWTAGQAKMMEELTRWDEGKLNPQSSPSQTPRPAAPMAPVYARILKAGRRAAGS